jgi:hypothetical protein
MCYNGTTYCLNAKNIQKKLDCGYTLGPCDAQQSAACDNTPAPDTTVASCVCSGKMVSITVRYIGPSFQDLNVTANSKKCDVSITSVTGAMTGDVFTVNAADGGLQYLRKETYFELVGSGFDQIEIPTNCCNDPLGKVYFPFEVIAWTDSDGNSCGTSSSRLDLNAFDSDTDSPIMEKDGATISQYPNPAEDKSVFEFTVPESQKVSVTVLNIRGQVVETIYSGNAEAMENYKIDYNVTDLQSGVYFVQLRTSNEVLKQKFVILK